MFFFIDFYVALKEYEKSIVKEASCRTLWIVWSHVRVYVCACVCVCVCIFDPQQSRSALPFKQSLVLLLINLSLDSWSHFIFSLLVFQSSLNTWTISLTFLLAQPYFILHI